VHMHEAKGNTGLARVMWRSVLVLDGFMLVFMPCAAAASNSSSGEVLLLLLMVVITGLALWYVVKAGLWFEWQLERTWQRTCAGIDGHFVGEKNDYLASVREGVQSRGKHYVPTQKKVAYPKLRDVRGDRQSWTAIVRPLYGQNVADFNTQADRFALAFHVPFVTFDLAENGLISVRAGQMPIPAAYNFQEQQIWDSTQN